MSSILGVDDMQKSTKPTRARHVAPTRHTRGLASRVIALRANASEHKTIGITSCQSGMGSSTVASNLAVAINAAVDGEVLFVDAVERSRLIGKRPAHPGWFDFVFGEAELADVVRATDVPKLSVIGHGAFPGNTIGTYNKDKLANITQLLKDRFEFVIFDLPSSENSGFCIPLACILDGTILVLKAGHVSSTAAMRYQQELKIQGVNLLGAVLNQTESHVPNFLRSWMRS
jgi:Mrp family chromosome partitioning ATPase